MEIGHIPVATAIAEPLELVPGLREKSYGFFDFPNACTANSAVSVFPKIIPLLRRIFDTILASFPDSKFFHR